MKINIPEIKYEAGHSYSEEWQLTDWCCVGCGKKSVWEEGGGGDYYVGLKYLCASCGASFYLPENEDVSDWQDRQRREAFSNSERNGQCNPSD